MSQNPNLHTPIPPALLELGWRDWFAQHLPLNWAEASELGRVATTARDRIHAFTGEGDVEARYRISTHGNAEIPAVGDWVLLSRYTPGTERLVQRILPRRTAFSRGAAGRDAVEQVVAANVDTVFLVESIETLRPRRLERLLAAAWSSGAQPVVVVNKSDLTDGSDARIREAEQTGQGVPVLPISAKFDADLSSLVPYCGTGQTIALIGSSGAGKSTLVNRLAGAEVARTGEVRGADRRGRHTTTHRELIRMSYGGLIIDTPGLREIQLWDARSGVARTFQDIADLAAQCRFRDCSHGTEIDCAVTAAMESGSLDPLRLQSYLKLGIEIQRLEAKVDQQARVRSKATSKAIQRQRREVPTRD